MRRDLSFTAGVDASHELSLTIRGLTKEEMDEIDAYLRSFKAAQVIARQAEASIQKQAGCRGCGDR